MKTGRLAIEYSVFMGSVQYVKILLRLERHESGFKRGRGWHQNQNVSKDHLTPLLTLPYEPASGTSDVIPKPENVKTTQFSFYFKKENPPLDKRSIESRINICFSWLRDFS